MTCSNINDRVMHQSNPTEPSPPNPPPPLPSISIFFGLGLQIPGAGKLKLQNAPRWARKKRANAPSSIHTVAEFSVDRTVE